MIISIRGTNGSGKSTVVETLLAKFKPALPRYGLLGPRRPEAYQLSFPTKKPVFVLGPYITSTGGVDNVQPYDLILDLINKYAGKGHVIFEGVIVSSSYGRVGRLMEEFGQEAVMAFMDTTLEQCIENVKKRRGARGDSRAFDPANLTSKFNEIVRSKKKMLEEKKLRVETISMKNGPAKVAQWLKRAS